MRIVDVQRASLCQSTKSMIQTLNLSNNLWRIAQNYLEKMDIDKAAEEAYFPGKPDIYMKIITKIVQGMM